MTVKIHMDSNLSSVSFEEDPNQGSSVSLLLHDSCLRPLFCPAAIPKETVTCFGGVLASLVGGGYFFFLVTLGCEWEEIT